MQQALAAATTRWRTTIDLLLQVFLQAVSGYTHSGLDFRKLLNKDTIGVYFNVSKRYISRVVIHIV
jgi:hypothetical protein